MFDTTISLGSILTATGMLVVVTVYILTVRNTAEILGARLRGFELQLSDVKLELKKLTEVLIAQAMLSGRIDRIEDRQLAEGKRLDDLYARVDSSVILDARHFST